MDPDTVRVLKLLDDVTRNLEIEGPVDLDEAYLQMIARVEAMPQNREGADPRSAPGQATGSQRLSGPSSRS